MGLDQDKVFKNYNEFSVNKVMLKVINIKDLISNKLTLNTYKDLADVEELKKIMKKRWIRYANYLLIADYLMLIK